MSFVEVRRLFQADSSRACLTARFVVNCPVVLKFILAALIPKRRPGSTKRPTLRMCMAICGTAGASSDSLASAGISATAFVVQLNEPEVG